MSEDKEWYTNLSRYELEGKHVHVLFSDGTMEGSLNLLEQIVYWNSDAGLKHVQILDWNKDRTWTRATGVGSVSLVWDERDWEQIRTEDISKADAIVVNGRLLRVTRVIHDLFFVEGCNPAHVSFVSCALRRRYKLPTEPGFYRDGNGTLYYLSTLAEFWIMRTRDKWDCMAWLPDKPLTPVHFVDGRAE